MAGPTVHFDLEALLTRVAADPGAPEFPAAAEALRRSGQVERARQVAAAGLECAPSRLAGRVALALVEMDLGRPDAGRRELEKVLDEMLEPYRLEVEPEPELIPVHAPPQPEVASPVVATPEVAPRPHAFGAVGEQEIDAAFDEAEAQADEMHSPNRMAQSILDAEAPFEAEPPPGHSPPSYAAYAAEAIEIGADDESDADEDEYAETSTDAEAGDGDGDDDDFDFGSSGTFATRTMAGLLDQQGDHHRADSIRSALGGGQREALAREIYGEPEPRDGFDPLTGVQAELASTDPAASQKGSDEEVGTQTAHRARVLATLETWLHNLTRRAA